MQGGGVRRPDLTISRQLELVRCCAPQGPPRAWCVGCQAPERGFPLTVSIWFPRHRYALSLSLTHTHTLPVCLLHTLSLSLSHTHCSALSLSLTLPVTRTHTLPLSLKHTLPVSMPLAQGEQQCQHCPERRACAALSTHVPLVSCITRRAVSFEGK